MAQLFADAARAYLSAGIAAGDTTISISSGGALFPVANGADWFKAVLQDASGIEIVYVTAHTSGANTFTVTRGQEGTTARSFAAGAVFGVRVTSADMVGFAAKLADAPSDGKTYGRKNAAWAEVAAGYSTPPGTVIFYAKNSPPTGYLKANGALVSRTTYAALFAAIGTTFGAGDGSTTFALPDLRGQFLRGWVDNGSVDSGRAFGSGQAHAYLNHTHTASGSTDTTGAHTHTFTPGVAGSSGTSGSSNGVSSMGISTTTSSAGDHTHTVAITVNNSTTGSTETRPVNVALLACIKY